MSDTNMTIEVKLESGERKEIHKLRQQQRDIKKEIKRLLNADKNSDKIEDWKKIHILKQEITERLKKKGVSWKKFVETPDYFEFAWYVSSGKAGAPRRIKTSMTKPPATETRTDEATMIKLATEYRSKMVRRKPRKKKTNTSKETSSTSSGKAKAVGAIGVG